MKNIVVLSASRYSLYSIAVVELLRRQGIEVSAIFVKKLFNLHRFKSEFSRDGRRLLDRIWNKLLFRKVPQKSKSGPNLLDMLAEQHISIDTLDDFSRLYNIPVIYCSDFNTANVVNRIKFISPQLVVFTGGGILRTPILEASGAGVVNCHRGILPHYRGMDVIPWPILEDRPHLIGLSVHFMNEGIDTGDILRIRYIPLQPGETIEQLRERFEPIMCNEIVSTCIDYLNSNCPRQPQLPGAGRQYFILHPRLRKIIDEKLSRKKSDAIL